MSKRLLSLIPYRHVTISTSLTLDEIINLFSKSISPKWDPIFQAPPPDHKNCQGEVSEQGFHIRMTDYYRGTSTYLALVLAGTVGFCFLLGALVGQNYFAVLAVSFVLIVLSAGLYFEADSLDWFIGNLLERHII